MSNLIFYAVVIAGTCKLTGLAFRLIDLIEGRR